MLFKKKFKFVLFFTSFFLLFPMLAGAVNFNQFITIKEDGTGILKIIYTEKESIIKEKNFLIGNLPFTKEKLSEYFSSQSIQPSEYKMEKSPNDNSLTQVSFLLNFKNIGDLNNLKGLANNLFGIQKTDTGLVYRNTINPEFFNTNSIDQIYTILSPKTSIKSTNGNKKDNTVVWFTGKDIRKNIKNPIYYGAVLALGGNKTLTKNGEGEEDKEKSCGLFGVELPVIVLLGSLLMNSRRRKFSK